MNSSDLMRAIHNEMAHVGGPLPDGVHLSLETFGDKVRVHLHDDRAKEGDESPREFAVAPFIDIALTTANELGLTSKLIEFVKAEVGGLLSSVLTPKTTPSSGS